MSLKLLDHPMILTCPVRRSGVYDSTPHIPCMALALSLTKPLTYVELGVLRGDMYFTVCQMVFDEDLPTKCYGIDLWEGDPSTQHLYAGYDGDEFYERVTEHNKVFSSFSKIIKEDSADAAAKFDDLSVDLLFIDADHSYEGVKRDFDAWLPKMSTRGVIVFHDTSIRRIRSCEVYRFWKEISAKYPSFEFPHAVGIGFICIGADTPEEMLDLCRSTVYQKKAIQEFFERLGFLAIEPLSPSFIKM